MTDRELLELAAKAAGIDATPYYGPSEEFWGLVVDTTGIEWNPLEDDGDALRLAVKLRLCVDNSGGEYGDRNDVSVGTEAGTGVYVDEDYGGDPGAATRRAIVRAAAEIGGAQ